MSSDRQPSIQFKILRSMYCITFYEKGKTHRASDFEKYLGTQRNITLLRELHSKFSDDELNRLFEEERKYIEIDGDVDELKYCIKQRPS